MSALDDYIRDWAARGILSAEQLNDLRKESAFDATGSNAIIPIVYGEKDVQGFYLGHTISGSNLIIRIGWCMGEIKQIKNVFINDKPMSDFLTVSVSHYRGTTIQGIDLTCAFVWAGTGYAEDMILRKKGDLSEGIAYSVFTIPIPTTGIESAPRFRAIIQGRTMFDPSLSSVNPGDPFWSSLSYAVDFIGFANGTTGTITADKGPNAQTVALNAGAVVQASNSSVTLNGTTSYIMLNDNVPNEWGTGSWTWETRFSVTSTAALQNIMIKDFSLYLYMAAGGGLRWSLSSTGGSWDMVADGVVGFTLVAGTIYTLAVEYNVDLRRYVVYVNGLAYTSYTHSTKTLYNNAINIVLGGWGSYTGYLAGSIFGARFTKGFVRYGGGHYLVTATPWPDSNTFKAGWAYSDNSALCFGDLAANRVFGGGMIVDPRELATCKQWCDAYLADGATPRAKLSLCIKDVNTTETYLDLLADYAQLIWSFGGDSIHMYPDRPSGSFRASGVEMLLNDDFTDGFTNWTFVNGSAGWTHLDGVIYIDGTQVVAKSLRQEIYLYAYVPYVITTNFSLTSGGTWTLFVGEQTIGSLGNGLHSYIVTPTRTGVHRVGMRAAPGMVGSSGQLSFKPQYWYDQQMEKGSLRVEPISSVDSPNKVTITWTKPVANSANWVEATSEYTLPDVNNDEVPLIETSVSMEGIYREQEASNRAIARVMRQRNRVRYTWVTGDAGFTLNTGVIVLINAPKRGVNWVAVTLDKVSMLGAGRWEVSGLNYSDEHYPNAISIPIDAGVIPVGAILPLLGAYASIPTGWARVSGMDNYYLLGSHSSVTVGGTLTATFPTLQSTYDAHHPADITIDSTGSINIPNENNPSTTSGNYDYIYTVTPDEADNHNHSLTLGTITPDPYRRKTIFVEKTGTTSSVIPAALEVFAHKPFNVTGIVQNTIHQGRMLQNTGGGMEESANYGNNIQYLALTSGSGGTAHAHYSRLWQQVIGKPGSDGNNTAWPNCRTQPIQGGVAHTHNVIVEIKYDPFTYRLGLYNSLLDYTPRQGMIVGWRGSLVTMPDSFWNLCNGLAGTPNLDNAFIEIASAANIGTYSSGTHGLSAVGFTDYDAGHGHDGSSVTDVDLTPMVSGHEKPYKHAHGYNWTWLNWSPPSQIMGFLMYNPYPQARFDDVKLLIIGGGTHGSTTVVDSSKYAMNGTEAGTVSYSNVWSKFSTTSLKLVFGQVTYTTAMINYQYRRFTFEFFMNLTAYTVPCGIACNRNVTTGINNYWELVLTSSTTLVLKVDGTTRITATGITLLNTPTFIAVQFDGNKYSLYGGSVASDDVLLLGTYTVASPATHILATALILGNDYANASGTRISAYFEEVRLSMDIARYGVFGFPIPPAPWPRTDEWPY